MLRLVAVLLFLVGAFLTAVIITALTSEGDNRWGVLIAFIIGAILAFAGAAHFWRRPAPGAGV